MNAISIGRGAALGVALKTVAEVRLEARSRGLSFSFEGYAKEGSVLAEATVREVLRRFNLDGFEATVSTSSEIPVGKGLKSSSTASNAIALATLSAIGEKLDDLSVVKLGVEASIKAGVTITGAFDDACASYFGGLAVTDNVECRILRREAAPEDISVVIHVPEEKMYTKDFDRNRLNPYRNVMLPIFDLALKGRYWEALTLNGFVHSAALGLTLKTTLEALKIGALAAGLSGTGPAVAAVCRREAVGDVKAAWSDIPGEVIVTTVNNSKAEGGGVR